MIKKFFKFSLIYLCTLLCSADNYVLPNHPDMPKANSQGRVITLNKMGGMTTKYDQISIAFLDYAKKDKTKKYLEIGAAYGDISLIALQNGNKIVANDIDKTHIKILSERAKIQNTISNLELSSVDFLTLNLAEGSIKGILISNVLHFLTGEQITVAFKKFYSWLEPNGKIFISTISVYCEPYNNYIEKFKYNKENGKNWPGFLKNCYQEFKSLKHEFPEQINLLDHEILIREALKAGFAIEMATLSSPQKEKIFLIAKKN